MQVRMEIPPGGSSAVNVELAILADDTPQVLDRLLG